MVGNSSLTHGIPMSDLEPEPKHYYGFGCDQNFMLFIALAPQYCSFFIKNSCYYFDIINMIGQRHVSPPRPIQANHSHVPY
jgi:hypothetical protein